MDSKSIHLQMVLLQTVLVVVTPLLSYGLADLMIEVIHWLNPHVVAHSQAASEDDGHYEQRH